MPFDFSSNKIDIYENINDEPRLPTAQRAGNVSHVISVHNELTESAQSALTSLEEASSNLQSSISTLEVSIYNLQNDVSQLINPSDTSNQSNKWLVDTSAYIGAELGQKILIMPSGGQDYSVFLPSGIPDSGIGSEICLLNVSANAVTVYLNGEKFVRESYETITLVSRLTAVFLIYSGLDFGWIPNRADAFNRGTL